MKQVSNKAIRIRQELVAAGMTSYGLLKGESKHLPSIIHDDEHIKGVIYGRRGSESAVFIATDRRMLYLEHKPFFRINDEVSYEVLSGVSFNVQGLFAGVTVHTRLGDYTLRFVNQKCATIFVKYLEEHRLETREAEIADGSKKAVLPEQKQEAVITNEVRLFLLTHAMATLSTIDRNGNVTGAAVYYALAEDNAVYIATKSGTRKAQNSIMNPQVAITVFDEANMQTLQMQGSAEVLSNPKDIHQLVEKLVKPRVYDKEIKWPPVIKLVAGDYVIIKIIPTELRFYDFNK